MSRPGDRWRDGRRAVERLARWYGDRRHADPLDALGEIGTVRRLLDEVELEAVRDARRTDRSWAEIATRLGISRQAAWERWRDLDDEATDVAGDAGRSLAERAALEGQAVTGPTRLRGRRTTVPDVVGLTVLDARVRLAQVSLVGVHHDPADDLIGDPEAVVTAQSPEPGTRLPRGSTVQLRTDGGGDAGVREPRRPRPTPLEGHKVVDDPAEDAVG